MLFDHESLDEQKIMSKIVFMQYMETKTLKF